MANLMDVQRVTAATGALLLLASCASTTLQDTWVDPGFTGGPVKKVFVLGLSARDLAARRVFEDIMVARLQAAGTQAVPAWQYLRDDGQVPEPALEAAIAQSGADSMLMTRLIGIDTRTHVSTVMVPTRVMMPGPGPGWWGMYNSWYAAPQVTQFQIATAETTLFDAKLQRIVWTTTSETFNPTSVQREAPGLADAVIGSLRAHGLIAAK